MPTQIIVSLYAKNKGSLVRLIFVPLLVTLSINYYLNREFYPALTGYQSESAVADFYIEQKFPADRIVSLDVTEFSTSFKLKTVIPFYTVEKVQAQQLQQKYVYTSARGLAKIDSLQLPRTVIKTFGDFHVTMLTGEFINKATRASTLSPMYLLKVGEQ